MKVQSVRDLLRKRCAEAGSQRAWCENNRVSQTYVSLVLAGKIEPGWKILDPLDLERAPADYVRRKYQPSDGASLLDGLPPAALA